MPTPGRNRLLLMGNLRSYSAKVLDTAPANLLAYWPLSEASGSVAADISGNARNGAYTGVDLGQTGIGDGRTAPYFDGVNDYCNVYSAGLAGAFSAAEGTLAGWAKVNSSTVWSTTGSHQLVRLLADASNFIICRKPVATNTVEFLYDAGGTTKTVSVAFSSLLWFHWSATWSKSGDQWKAYLNGAQVGTTQTGLGTWSGAIAAATTLIGASTQAPAEVWNGNLAHTALWSTPLSAAQIASLASLT